MATSYGLLLLFGFSSLQATLRPGLATLVIWFIQVLPLLCFLPVLHKTRLRAYAWLSFVILAYFIHGVLVAFDPDRTWLGVVEALLCGILFGSLIWFIRAYRTHFNVGL
ncbi:MAG: hypothetical protein RLZZ385_1887 [Pseudomonadota bacterium]